jgi:C4-dicarboxylate-specific signal transduction histidine kinase
MKRSILSLAVFSLVGMSSAHAWCVFSCPDEAPKEAHKPVVVAETAKPAVAAESVVPAHPYALSENKNQPANSPSWFVKMPADTADMVFAVGVGKSLNEQMAFNKAQVQAEAKLSDMLSAEVRSSTKSYSNDTGDVMVESNEITIHRYSEAVTAGAQRVDSQRNFDGRYYTVYVLMRLPLGENNVLRKDFETKKVKREAELRSARAHQELESKSDKRKADSDSADQKLKREIGPKAETSELKLLDVDNEAYKARRDEALSKPNAVVGQTVIR